MRHSTAHILVVEDDAAMLQLIAEELTDAGYQVSAASTPEQALLLIEEHPFTAVVTDLNLGRHTTGLDLAKHLLKHEPDLPIVLITAFGTMQTAIEAIRQGVYDFLTKPFAFEELILTIHRAVELRGLKSELTRLKKSRWRDDQILGDSPVMVRMLNHLSHIADTRATVLLLGESGTGKTRIARMIHDLSERAQGPLVVENMAAIPEHLIESEIFGHARGAFTGATTSHKGLFERADGGTLVLDEIGELPLALQPKLLHVLEARELRPVGSEKLLRVNVRLVAATNKDLEEEVAAGRFRQDLYFRLAVCEISVPSLRERGRDVLTLAHHFTREFAAEYGRELTGLHPTTALELLHYTWPGNIRELRMALQFALVMSADRRTIQPGDLPPDVLDALSRQAPTAPPTPALVDAQRNLLEEALADTEGNISAVARRLGVARSTVYRMMDRYALR